MIHPIFVLQHTYVLLPPFLHITCYSTASSSMIFPNPTSIAAFSADVNTRNPFSPISLVMDESLDVLPRCSRDGVKTSLDRGGDRGFGDVGVNARNPFNGGRTDIVNMNQRL